MSDSRSESWRLGDTVVHRIGFGAMRLVASVAFGAGEIGDPDQAIRVLRRAIELGVDHIDTAGFYGTSLHAANDLIRAALWPYPDDLVIATKVRPDKGLAEGVAASGWLRSQVEQNLRQLGLDSLDLNLPMSSRLPTRMAPALHRFGSPGPFNSGRTSSPFPVRATWNILRKMWRPERSTYLARRWRDFRLSSPDAPRLFSD